MKVVNPKCVHAINEMAHVFMNWPFILEQVPSGGEQNDKRNVIQFAFVFMLVAND